MCTRSPSYVTLIPLTIVLVLSEVDITDLPCLQAGHLVDLEFAIIFGEKILLAKSRS